MQARATTDLHEAGEGSHAVCVQRTCAAKPGLQVAAKPSGSEPGTHSLRRTVHHQRCWRGGDAGRPVRAPAVSLFW
eukprot:scaffold12967_cov120-Isochrysis_galbana.AAC.7